MPSALRFSSARCPPVTMTLRKKSATWTPSVSTNVNIGELPSNSVKQPNKSHLTAIGRRSIPTPTKWLLTHSPAMMYSDAEFKKLGIKVLDYGCGHCYKVNPSSWHNYDPYYQPNANFGTDRFDIIICNYVLCVLPRSERLKVLQHIQVLLRLTGIAYITVRNDRPKQGWGVSSKGTYQGRVSKLPLREIYSNSNFRIYLLTKESKLV